MKNKTHLSMYYTYSIFKNLVFQRGIFMIFLLGKGISTFQIGILQAALFLTSLLAEVPAGYFGDKFKRRKSVLLGLALTIISGAGYLYFDKFYSFLVLFIIEGLGMAFISGSDQSLLYDNIKSKNKKDDKNEGVYITAMSKASSLSFYALGIATFLGGILQKISWNLVYGLFILSMSIAFLAILFIEEDTSCYQPLKDKNDLEMEPSKDIKVIEFLKSETGKHLFFLMVVIAVFDSALLNYFMFSQELFHHLSIDTAVIGALYMISRFTSGYGYTLAPKLSKKYSISFLCHSSMLLTSLLLVLNFAQVNTVSIIVFLVVMILPNVFDAMINNYFHDNIPSEIRATVISVRSMVESGVVCLFYLGFGKILDIVKAPYAMGFLAIFPVACSLMLFFNAEFNKRLNFVK